MQDFRGAGTIRLPSGKEKWRGRRERFEGKPVVKIAPSVLGADFSCLDREIKSTEAAGADMLHLDIMDGHFVPNISFGPGITGAINDLTDLFLDVHLMLAEPERYFEPFAMAGADLITFHLEVHPDPTGVAKELRSHGLKAGICINPDTDVAGVLPYLEHFDHLLVMSVFPGFGGQKFIETALDSIRTAKQFIDSNGLTTLIEVDGGVDKSNAARVAQAGADILVMGSAFFKAADRSSLVELVHGL